MEEKKTKKAKQFRSIDDPISLDELKEFLWGAATRLRGQIDAAGYKEYIFPLLFFKRISDVYDEQFAGFAAEGGEEYAKMQADDLAIRIPDGAHWDNVREATEDVGRRLVEAFVAIEQANPGEVGDGRIIGGLESIFGPKDGWLNKAKMPDYIITNLIEYFSLYTLNLKTCPADEMGQAYEYLIGKFADDAGNTAQEFYTNRTVVTLMAEILQPKPNETIYDPTCGSGGMLIKCLNYLKDKNLPWQGVKVFGQEINAISASIARMNLYLNGVEDFSIVRKDTLLYPAYVDGSQLRKFDIVLANPPYSIKNWNREAFEHDKWGRNFLGTPPQSKADYAFIQHILSSMNEKNGRCAILLPHGILNRLIETEIRKKLLEADLIDTVISIGKNLFYNSPMEACILICRTQKEEKKKGKILLIKATDLVERKNSESYLTEEHIKTILSIYNSYSDIEGRSCVIENKDVPTNNYTISPKYYVKSTDTRESQNLDVLLQNWKEASVSLHNSLSTLMEGLI